MKITSPSSVEAARRALGFKAFQAAEKLGLSASYYSEIEKGRKPIPTHLQAKFRDVLGVEMRAVDTADSFVVREMPAMYGAKSPDPSPPPPEPPPSPVVETTLRTLAALTIRSMKDVNHITDPHERQRAEALLKPYWTAIENALATGEIKL